jgi:hypothetical protein
MCDGAIALGANVVRDATGVEAPGAVAEQLDVAIPTISVRAAIALRLIVFRPAGSWRWSLSCAHSISVGVGVGGRSPKCCEQGLA